MQSSLRLSQVFACLLLLILSIAAPASAAPHWVQATPFGGEMRALAQSPSSPQTLYTATSTGRVFRSLDGGAPRDTLARLTVSPASPQILFAAGAEGIWKSTDGGVTFRPFNRGLETADVVSVLVDPASSDRVYAATLEKASGVGMRPWAAGRRSTTACRRGISRAPWRSIPSIRPPCTPAPGRTEYSASISDSARVALKRSVRS